MNVALQARADVRRQLTEYLAELRRARHGARPRHWGNLDRQIFETAMALAEMEEG